MLHLAEVAIPEKQVERLSKQIGAERTTERDTQVAAWESLPLAEREQTPALPASVVGVVEMDGGRMQIRGPNWGKKPTPVVAVDSPSEPEAAANAAASTSTPVPTEPAAATAPTTRLNHWREDKAGCVLRLTSTVSASDPCPEIPAVFVDPLRSLTLAQEIGHAAVPEGAPFARAAATETPKTERPGAPQLEQRVLTASRADNHAFGPILAALTWSLGLFGATRQAFLADGASGNWTVHKTWFPRFEPILDFLHALTYVYASAMAGRNFAAGWPIYTAWIQWVWSGQVAKVIAALTERLHELGEPLANDAAGSPWKVVREALTYLTNNQEYMKYDDYRCQGLPLMTSYAESAVKQINRRVKGTEKFWSEEGAEAILQLRADYLSDTEPMKAFWQRRQDGMTGHRRYRQAA